MRPNWNQRLAQSARDHAAKAPPAPAPAPQIDTPAALARLLIASYTAASPAPADASWWARARHADRVDAARRKAEAAFSHECYERGALASAKVPPHEGAQPSTAAWNAHHDAKKAAYTHWSVCSEPNYSLVATVGAAAGAAVRFVDEPEPASAHGRVGLGKGCCSVSIPPGAIGRRGGGESSWLVFYDREGAIVDAYQARCSGPQTWAESVDAAKAAERVAIYPLLPLAKIAEERFRQAIFGGA